MCLDMLIKIHSFLIELHEINYDDISEHSIGKDKSSLNLFPLKPDLRAIATNKQSSRNNKKRAVDVKQLECTQNVE